MEDQHSLSYSSVGQLNKAFSFTVNLSQEEKNFCLGLAKTIPNILVTENDNNYDFKIDKKDSEFYLELNPPTKKILIGKALINLGPILKMLIRGHLDKKINSNTQERELILSQKNALKILRKKTELSFLISSPENKIQDLKTFPYLLINLSHFKHYFSAHLLVHERGNSICSYYYFSAQHGIGSDHFSANRFNTIFSTIRKSKNKAFHESQLKAEKLKLIGTLLGTCFKGSSCDIVLMLSRNDFLPPASNEISNFENYSLEIFPQLERQFLKESQESKAQAIVKSIELYPLPIVIQDKSGTVVYRNMVAQENNKEIYKSDGDKLELGNQFKLFVDKNFFIQTPFIFNAEKISLLGELLNTLRHELSNPFFGLQLSCQILLSENLSDDNKHSIEQILVSIQRCQKIIQDFTSLFKSDDKITSVSAKKVIEEAITLAKSELRSIRRSVEYQIPVEEGPAEIIANDTWCVQILFNLILNSIQAIRGQSRPGAVGKITIRVTQDNENVYIDVEDDGPGLTPHIGANIFLPFFTTKSEGTGLGLAISKNLAERMNGDLSLRASSVGAIFRLSLKRKGKSDVSI